MRDLVFEMFIDLQHAPGILISINKIHSENDKYCKYFSTTVV